DGVLPVHEMCPFAASVARLAGLSPTTDKPTHERHPHQRGCRDAGSQREHAALLGTALRLPATAADDRWTPPVRPARARGASPGPGWPRLSESPRRPTATTPS